MRIYIYICIDDERMNFIFSISIPRIIVIVNTLASFTSYITILYDLFAHFNNVTTDITHNLLWSYRVIYSYINRMFLGFTIWRGQTVSFWFHLLSALVVCVVVKRVKSFSNAIGASRDNVNEKKEKKERKKMRWKCLRRTTILYTIK